MVRTSALKDRRRVALFVAAIGLGALGCNDRIDPATIEASTLARGSFRLEAGRTDFVETTSTVPCDVGTIFGVDYVIEAEGARRGGVLPLEFRWRHPELSVPSAKIWGTETPGGASNPRLEWGVDRLEGRALWRIEEPEERQAGRYEFLVRETESGRVLLSESFDVEGC